MKKKTVVDLATILSCRRTDMAVHRSSVYMFCTLFVMSFTFSYSAYGDVLVTSVAQLVAAVNNTQSGGDKTILVADGNYQLGGHYLRIAVTGVTVRSQSGTRENVILDGNYQTTEIFQIVASNATISDLTLKRAQDHPIHVMGGSADVENTLISNVHIIDPGEQAIKINLSGLTGAHRGIIKNSLIELTESGRNFVENDNSNSYSCYTGGIDGHGAAGWIIQDNEIHGFWCTTGLSEHGVHFWSDSSDTVVERNRIVDCDRGIGFGLGGNGHSGGVIRNNMIYQGQNHGYSDVGISLESAAAAQVYNNTIILENGYPNAIEYRFAASNNLSIFNNLTNQAISSRDGGSAGLLSHNVDSALSSWFRDAASGDLHLASERSGVTSAALSFPGLSDDFDRQSRPLGTGLDIGADEYSPGLPDPTVPGTTGNQALGWLLLLLKGSSL